MEEKFKKVSMMYEFDADSVHYSIEFADIYSKIQATENDIEFVYAVLTLIDSLSTARNFIQDLQIKYMKISGSVILKNAFVIADLTGQRGGVYYETGYAVAKDKLLILSCKKSTEEKPHFDVAQINTIFWEDEGNLYSRLTKRIKATIK